jgi:hypothetical protein
MHSKPTTEIVQAVESEHTDRFWFHGGRTFLQRRALSEAGAQLRDVGKPVVLLAPSTGEDASHVAMLETVAQLREQSHSNRTFENIVDPSLPWEKKITAFSDGLQSLNGGTSFLLCDPALWPATEEDTSYWKTKTDQVCAALFEHAPMLVYTGNCMQGLPVGSKHVFRAPFYRENFLKDHFADGPLAETALATAESLGGADNLDERHIRLMVALTHMKEEPMAPSRSLYPLI